MFLVGNLGQVLLFNPKELPENAPSAVAFIFALLKQAHKDSSAHTKPKTFGCDEAILVRVTNERVVGVERSTELKSRMFYAEDIEGKPIIVACHYLADSTIDIDELRNLMPKDSRGNTLIKLPHSLSVKKVSGFDIGDEIGREDIYSKAALITGLGMGEINPLSLIHSAVAGNFRLYQCFDKRFVSKQDAVTTNLGERRLGSYTPSGAKYAELAIGYTPKISVAGKDIAGYAVGDFTTIEKYTESSLLRDLYGEKPGFLQGALASSHKVWSRERF